MASVYPYQPLNNETKEIRLLDFTAKTAFDDESPITCHMRSIALIREDTPAYFAVSYCWGDAGDSRDIIIGGIQVAVPRSAE
jgi:hypothetical protein